MSNIQSHVKAVDVIFWRKEIPFTSSNLLKVGEVADLFCNTTTVTFVQSSGTPGLIGHLQSGRSSACLLVVSGCFLSPVVPSFRRMSGAERQM